MSSVKRVSDLITGQKVVPVVVIEDQQQAHGLAEALLAGGINVIEITLRNAYGVSAIAYIKKTFSDMVVLAGTVTNSEQFKAVAEAGVDGVISPGLTPALLQTAKELDVPFLPGVATSSDILTGMEYGLTEFKLFPATVVGGIGALKAYNGPFSSIRFCPTGGVSPSNLDEFLALPNVMCVGGSWLAPLSLVREGNWEEITRLCKETKNV